MGVAIRVHREGDDAVALAVLGHAFEGAPGRAHGGIVAAIFDDAVGFVLSMETTPAFTGASRCRTSRPRPFLTAGARRSAPHAGRAKKLLVEGEPGERRSLKRRGSSSPSRWSGSPKRASREGSRRTSDSLAGAAATRRYGGRASSCDVAPSVTRFRSIQSLQRSSSTVRIGSKRRWRPQSPSQSSRCRCT
jgi:hypothetical protein